MKDKQLFHSSSEYDITELVFGTLES